MQISLCFASLVLPACLGCMLDVAIFIDLSLSDAQLGPVIVFLNRKLRDVTSSLWCRK